MVTLVAITGKRKNYLQRRRDGITNCHEPILSPARMPYPVLSQDGPCGPDRRRCSRRITHTGRNGICGNCRGTPEIGLYAAMLGMFVYALLGTSRQLAVTPTSSSAAMLAALIAPLVSGDPVRYKVLVSVTTIVAGLI